MQVQVNDHFYINTDLIHLEKQRTSRTGYEAVAQQATCMLV